MEEEDTTKKNLTNALVPLCQKGSDISSSGTERKQLGECLKKMSECFLNLKVTADENINRLVCICGEFMGATCALYNRLEKGMLCSAGQWHTPQDYKPLDKPQGHICYDVIMHPNETPFIVRNLQNSPYAQTDPNVIQYKLQTYVGMPVKFNNTHIGALCVVFQEDFVPSVEDLRFMEIIASAIAVEEDRRQTQLALEESNKRYAYICETVTDYIYTVHIKDGKPLGTIHGPSCVTVTGYTAEEFAADPNLWIKMVIDEDRPAVLKHISLILSGERVKPIEHRIIRKDGAMCWIRNTIVSHFDDQGRLLSYDGLVQDITERKQAEEELELLNKELIRSNKRLRQLALRDPQTGLYNHRYLEEAIEAEFYRAKRYVHPLSVMMLDVDYFKSINDVYGHHFGDLVLKQLARQLKKMVRQYDIVTRLGGEEFMIISPGIDRSGALILAQRLLDAINLYNFGDKKQTVKLKLSVAVASYPEDKIIRGMDLVTISDQILGKLKECGGNNVSSYLDIQKKDRSVRKTKVHINIRFLKDKIDKLTKRTNQSLIEAVFAFAKTLELKDHFTGEHVEKTVQYATEIARVLDLPPDEIDRIKQAAILHDLGKIGISEKILVKKLKLTKQEFEEIKKHPQIGVDIIRPVKFLHNIIPLILYHHERWDGKGYPNGLKGEEIPIGARVVALADVYEALISNRPYRKAYPEKEALKIIKKGSGTQFDPRVVTKFVQIMQKKE